MTSDDSDFLKEISNMLRDTESLLMDFDMAPAASIDLDDSVISVPDTTTDDDFMPLSPPPRATPRQRQRATTSRGGVQRRRNANSGANASTSAAAAAAARLSIVDLSSSPMPPPRVPPARRRRGAAATRSPARGRSRGRRARRSYSSPDEDEEEIVSLDDSVVDLNVAGPSGTVGVSEPSTSNDTSTGDGTGPNCPICLCTWTTPVSTLCGHIFCKQCIAQWLKVTKKCPVCKAGPPKLKTHPIFIA